MLVYLFLKYHMLVYVFVKYHTEALGTKTPIYAKSNEPFLDPQGAFPNKAWRALIANACLKDDNIYKCGKK